MTPYDGGPTVSSQQPHNGVGPPPIPRPPPLPGGGLGSPAVSGDVRHRQPPHMGMGPGPHRQQSSAGMNYPMAMQMPPSPNLGGPNGGPPGPPYHHPHHPSQARHYSQQRHQQNVGVPPHPSQHGGVGHHSHPQHHTPSHHPPQHHLHPSVGGHPNHNASSQHGAPPPHHSQHHRGPHNGNSMPSPSPQHSMSHAGHVGPSHGHPSMRSQHGPPQSHPTQMMQPPPSMDDNRIDLMPKQQQQHEKESMHSGSGLNGDWQSDKDLESRRIMIQQIVKLLKQRDKNASPEWLSKLPQMVKQLEVSLYRTASSFQEYSDTSTLKQRLQKLAIQIAKKTQQSKDGMNGNGTNNYSKRRNGNHMNNGNSMYRKGQGSSNQQDVYRRDGYPTNSSSQASQDPMMARRQHEMNARRSRSGVGGGDNRQVNLSDINPMMSSSSSAYQGSHNGSIAGNEMRGESPFHSNMPSLNDSKPSKANFLNTSSGSQPGSSNMNNLNGSSSSQHKIRSDQNIKNRQNRLLLLHHSYKCTAEKGQCKVSFCPDMKRLWKHMARCKDPRCQVPHCFSSRSILSHYKECKDPKCHTCAPVRDKVRNQQSSSKNNAFSRHRMSNGQSTSQQPQPYNHLSSSSSDRQKYPNGFGADNTASFGQPDPSTYHSSYHNDNNLNSSHSSGPLSYRSDPQSPNRMSPNTGYAPAHIPSLSGDQRNHQKPQAVRSSLKNNASEDEKVKHKQQRLVLLRHASKCGFKDGKCPHTEHCAAMKRLWRHIADCKVQNCKVQHCISSRYVLTHYRDCTDPNCQVCDPVRRSIKRSNEKKKQGYRGNPKQDLLQGDLNICEPILSQPQQPTKRVKLEDGMSRATQPSGNELRVGFAPPHSTPRRVSAGNRNDNEMRADLHRSGSSNVYSKRQVDAKPEKSNLKDSGAKNDIPSLMNCFTIEQIETHIKSLNRTHQLSPSDLKKRCIEVLKGLQSHEYAWVFANPVDPVELNLADYFDIIRNPMDLGTIQKRIDNGLYHSVEEFAADVNLTFDNALLYNHEGTPVNEMALKMKTKFAVDYEKVLKKLQDEEEQRRKNERACSLCGCEKLLFEPPVFFCNGLNCQSKRIRRNSHFHVAGNNQYFWCNPCFNELDEKTKIELGDMTVKKSDLKKKKNDEVHEESWVQCDDCNKWIHQICGLFNARQNKELKSVYCCPECTIKKRKAEKKAGKKPPVNKVSMAVDLPRTKLSERLEKHVRLKVEEKSVEIARNKASTENCTVEQALKAMNLGGPVTIRQVTSTDRKMEVRERMKTRYAYKNYPDEFTFRCKCITVFQNLDGIDVLLFALYVYEHNEKNPPPNQRTVYISYLDSVHFMRPRKIRTLVYHEILICYLNYAMEKGFSKAHIWACPPLKGDDYIFYAKPEDQKTPKDARLRQWYVDMLIECQKQGIVGKLTNMYDLYFKDKSLDATAVPYLEGDYFAGEVENVIKDIEEGNDSKAGSKKTKKKRNSSKNDNKTKSKSKSNRGGTRSAALDEDSNTVSDVTVKNGKDGEQDAVMVKLGEIIQPMKASFIVAFLNWSGASKENRTVPKEIEKEREERKKKAGLDNGTVSLSNNSKKRDADGNIRESKDELLRRKIFFGTNITKNNRSVKIIDDDAEDMDCEFFNNRQSFLDLCRGNHYQFDELRRAKHTSMMVLWHLHNRDAPKFVQQCATCSSEILTGLRYNCSICQDYDLCESCYKNPNLNRGACSHELKPISVERKESRGTSAEIEEQRRQTQKNIQLHLRLLDHASRCNSLECQSKTCAKMKGFLKHTVECKIRVTGGCKICKRLWTLLRYHAQQCKNPNCTIPLCKDIRIRIRQMQKQQQAMDDRRRQQMNWASRNENR